jgi:hypothetical protein
MVNITDTSSAALFYIWNEVQRNDVERMAAHHVQMTGKPVVIHAHDKWVTPLKRARVACNEKCFILREQDVKSVPGAKDSR